MAFLHQVFEVNPVPASRLYIADSHQTGVLVHRREQFLCRDPQPAGPVHHFACNAQLPGLVQIYNQIYSTDWEALPSVKDYAASPATLQQLVDLLGMPH